ncbi:MAG: ribosome-associated translation inhibitor RaiA [Candidatus Rokubacteria bacterium]|nr:ribosome-associated translation inhibitor RaiA [Candidatus Rokubacteria bacterium]
MGVIISTRGFTVSNTYKDALTRRLDRLARLLPKLTEARIVLSKEKHRRTAALTLRGKHRTFRSTETAEDLSVAVDLAIAALTRQVRETKDRVRSHGKGRRRPPAAAAVPETAAPDGELVVRRVAAKPMSVEEAAAQLELGREQFLVFTNAGTDSVNVLYRRKSGGLGLIEPVA